MSRVSQQDQGRHHHRRKRGHGHGQSGGKAGERRRLVLIAWSVIVGLAAVGVMGVVLLIWLRSEMGEKEELSGKKERLVVEKGISNTFIPLPEDEALAIVKEALAVRDPELIAGHFRLDGETGDEVVEFLENLETVDGEVKGMQWSGLLDVNGVLMESVLVNSSYEGSMKYRLVMLVPDESGGRLVDFGAFARKTEPSWHEFFEGKADSIVARVVVAKDSYFNAAFIDESEWVAYTVASPEMEETKLYGYCRRNSAQHRALERIFGISKQGLSRVGGLQRVTVEVRRVEGGQSRQVEISRVVAADWVVTDRSFDEEFR